MAGPDGGRVFGRQVTTATPARLDLRATGVADEGCADTMSTESNCSIARYLSVLKSATLVATYNRQRFVAFVANSGNDAISVPCWQCSSGFCLIETAKNLTAGSNGARLEAGFGEGLLCEKW